MKISFTFPEIQHPTGDLSIYELAGVLEAKYKILETFTTKISEKIKERFFKQLMRGGINTTALSEWLKNEWRQYIINNSTGINTKASQERGDPSFINTSAYYLSMQPKITFSDKEKKLLKKFK